MRFLIFSILAIFLFWILRSFARTSSTKIANKVRSIIVIVPIIIAAIFVFFGKFLFSLPFLVLILPLLKIKGGLSLFKTLQIFRLLSILRQQGRWSFSSGANYSQKSSSISLKDAYAILDCQEGDPREKVEKNYKKLMMKLHPDKNKDVDSTKISQMLTEAKNLIITTHFS